ncbi:sulfite exporter TauE/SafE family protein [Colwellia sp. E2M01]|uniref:sulfite exporter TauE/SafE family protein n=1 Tax=Colwellia sp. E2M01 TaxID=2841561 RepID=UPI001C08CF09|nr:sulfite exporter TauE/SafE family protein [Colwellia sp. E2M01]MBU2869716.1 sulfite exporter TauE/SafE family protein [Colwellia sp. E2M01]
MSIDLFSAFLIGLLGSGHCLVMCGGITTILTSALNKPVSAAKEGKSTTNKNDAIAIKVISTEASTQASSDATTANEPVITHSRCNHQITRLALILFYHIGRIGSYAFIGAIVGFTGSIAAKNIGLPIAGLRLVAAIFVILLGLYIGQWLLWLNRIEALGKGLWRKLSPLAKHVLPVDNRRKALGLGALWGWLPCGLVYSTLTWALASGSSITGAAIMLCFGLGTLPALIALSFGISHVNTLLNSTIFRKLMALSLIAYGIYSFIVAYQMLF